MMIMTEKQHNTCSNKKMRRKNLVTTICMLTGRQYFTFILMVSLFVYVSSASEDDVELSSGWFGNPALPPSSSSSSLLPPPPPGFYSQQPQQQQDNIPICSLDLFENNDDIVRKESIIVDGCLLDCGGKTILSAVSGGSNSVIIRKGGHVKDCPLLLMEPITAEESTSSSGTSAGTSLGTYEETSSEEGITGFLCDEGDCTLTDISCNVANKPLFFVECVLVKSGATIVNINGGLVTDKENLTSLYGIVVDAGGNSDDAAIDDESEDSNNNKKTQLFVHNATIVNQYYDGIKILNGVETIRITDSILSNNRGDGIDVKGGSGLKFLAIIGGSIENNGDDGIYVNQFRRDSDGYIVFAVVEMIITDVVVNNNREDGIRIVRVNKVTIDDATIDTNGLDGINVLTASVINIQGIISKNNVQNGFSTEAIGSDVTITNSVFLNNGYDIKNEAQGSWKRSGVYTWLPKSVVITNTVSNGNRMDGFAIYDSPTLIMSYVDAMRNGDDGIQVRESSTAYGYDYTSGSDYLVGVYYYPWHGKDFHNGQGYLRKDLIPPQLPMLGEYDDSDPDVIAQHMEWFRKANIGLLVTSWWGPDRIEDTNTLEVIMEHEHIGNLKIALHYETTGRIKDGKNMTVPRSDIQYMCENYFDHPNYYKIDGRPVVVMYISRKLEKDGILVEALLTMKSEAAKCGQNLFLIGDAVFAKAPDQDEPFISFSYFDAVTNYDVYGSSGKPNPHAGKESVDNYYEEQKKWRDLAIKENCRYIPPVSPGYNDRGVRLDADNPPLSRRLSEFSDEGSLFLYQLQKALPLVDPNVDNMILINSFNEWHEDTQIEPTAIGGFAKTPEALTGGLEYVGYGERYLDILRTQTKNDKKGSTSANIVPSSNVYFTNVHTCSNSHDGVTFYITENDDDNQFNDLGNRDIELVFTPGPDVVSCKNKRFDYELHGGGNLAFNSTSAIIGDTCANGRGTSDCSAISISDCDDSNSKCRHRDIITSGGTILKDHEIQ